MKLDQLNQIQKLYFGHEELARALGITLASARVAASRYVKQGLLVRIRNNKKLKRASPATQGSRFTVKNKKIAL